MEFKEAFALMKQGEKVKLPSWKGYWEYEESTDSILMHCKDGCFIKIRALENIMSDEWIIADEENMPVLGDVATFDFGEEATFGFGEAIEYLKLGFKVARKGWNGKGMFLWLKPAATIKKEWCRDPMLLECIEKNGNEGEIEALGTICMFTHDSTGRNAILTGWLASQSDMLLEDWCIVE